MIDRIQDNNYYSQNTAYGKKVKSNTETFSMDYSNREEVGQQENIFGEKNSVDAGKLLMEDKDQDGGVRLELSSEKKERRTVEVTQEPERLSDLIPERLKNLFRDIKAAFVRFFSGNAASAQETEEQADDTGVKNVPAESEQLSIKKEHIFEEETETGQLSKSLTKAEEAYRAYAKMQEEKTLAKNSDLLTTYNKRGSFVQMNADDKNRILHAHPHEIDETF